MSAVTKSLQLLLILGIAVPQLSFAAPSAPNRKSRKLSVDEQAVKNDILLTPSGGMAANSYSPAPLYMPITTPVFAPPQDNTALMGLTTAMMAMAGQMMNSPRSSNINTDSYKDAPEFVTQVEVDTMPQNPGAANPAPEQYVASGEVAAAPADLSSSTLTHPRSRKYSPSNLAQVKADPTAASGACLAPVSGRREAQEILDRNGVGIGKANDTQIISLAKGIQQVELLAGRRSSLIAGTVFTFPKIRPLSRQASGNMIEMGRNHTDGNVAHLIHELGHPVGNRGLYASYRATVSNKMPCHLSGYSDNVNTRQTPRNEEFAEAWAAFVTNPEMLKDSDIPGCRKAFAFFESRFPNARKYAVCNSSYLASVVKGGGQQLASIATKDKDSTTGQP